MKSQRPIFQKQTPDGTCKLYNATGDEIGTIKDPQDADTIVACVNSDGDYSRFGGNTWGVGK